MTYLTSLSKIFALDTNVYTELEKTGRLFASAFINVFVAGLLFGLANLYHTRLVLREELAGGFESPLMGIVVFALLVFVNVAFVYLAHAGFSLLLWSIGRGFKGLAPFFPVYLYTGAALAPLWLGLPFIFLYSKNIASPLSLLLGTFGMAWAFVTVTRSVMASQNFNFPRAASTLALTIIFIVSLRIIWS